MDKHKKTEKEKVTKEKVIAAIEEMSDEEFEKFVGGLSGPDMSQLVLCCKKKLEDGLY